MFKLHFLYIIKGLKGYDRVQIKKKKIQEGKPPEDDHILSQLDHSKNSNSTSPLLTRVISTTITHSLF